MSEHKHICGLVVVTDSENAYDKIGDIQTSSFDQKWLKDHIQHYGTEGLLENLAILQKQVLEAKWSMNREIVFVCNNALENIVSDKDKAYFNDNYGEGRIPNYYMDQKEDTIMEKPIDQALTNKIKLKERYSLLPTNENPNNTIT